MKRKIENFPTEDDSTKTKKEQKFHAKTFRQSLSNENAIQSVKEFLQLCMESDQAQDYCKDYLEAGGTCSELLRVINRNKNVGTATTIFQTFSIVLLKIISSYPEKIAAAEETCRELLNNYYNLVKSMLSLSAKTQQRVVALKLLSTMTTVSSEIAKEVLAHTDFEPLCLKVLTQPSSSGDDKSCRTSFIHFLIAFLIEGTTHTKISLLKKPALLCSIFPGMIYDTFYTINLVLSTLRSKVLEDSIISKTLKMNTFNTQVIQNLVSLYNWKGPSLIKDKKSKRIPTVDSAEKELVADCVHSFLLMLCTSYKFGVIFNDPTVGLTAKNYNSLIYTVLQKIKTPWEQKLTAELVINISVACPDLVKFVLSDLEPFLDPRVSSKWTSAVRFIKKILENLTPNRIAQYFTELSTMQIAAIIKLFTAPKVLLKVISSDTILHEHIGVRHQGILLLNMMFELIFKYFDELKNIQSKEDFEILKNNIVNYLSKYLPPASVIISDWKLSLQQVNVVPDPTISSPDLQEHLSKVLDVLYYYNILCPHLVDNITKELQPTEFIEWVETLSKNNEQHRAELLRRAINLLLLCDTSLFLPSSDCFKHIVQELLNLYYTTSDKVHLEIESLLRKILINSGIFEGCLDEIMVWLYSVLEQESYSKEIGHFFVHAIQNTYQHFLKYITDLSKLKESIDDESSFDIKQILENLYNEKNEIRLREEYPKHTILSPLILGIINSYSEFNLNEVCNYLNTSLTHLLHLQTSPKLLKSIVLEESNSEIFSKYIIKYYKNYLNSGKIKRLKVSTSSPVIVEVIQFLLNETEIVDIQTVFNTNGNSSLRYYHISLINRLLLFYFTQLCENNSLTEVQERKFSKSVIYFLKKIDDEETFSNYLNDILNHPVLLQLFNAVFNSERKTENLSTKFVNNVISEIVEIKGKLFLESYVNSYRKKLVEQLISLFKDIEEHGSIHSDTTFLEVVYKLGFLPEQSTEVMNCLVKLQTKYLISVKNNSSFLELLCYLLNKNVDKKEFDPFSADIMTCVNEHLKNVHSMQIDFNLENLESSLFSYLEKYPHSKKQFSEEFFKILLKKPVINKSTARLCMLLLENNKKFLEVFVEEIDKIVEKRELIFTLLQAILKDDNEKLDAIFEKVYKVHETILIKYLNKPQKISNYLIDNYKVAQKLLESYYNKEKYTAFVSTTHKFDVSEFYHVEILTAVFRKSLSDGEVSQKDKFKYISNYNIIIMNILINTLKKGEVSDENWNKIEKIANLFSVWLKDLRYTWHYTDENFSKNSTFQTFSKFGLKFGLQGNSILLKIVNHLCFFVNNDDSYLDDLFQMTVSHSEALNILLSENNLKANVLELLLTICKKCPSVMAKNHIPVWLGAYRATLSDSDQFLLQLMKLYEENNVGFEDYRPYLWGNAAVGHYSVRYGVETALWKQPKPKEILNLFEETVINNTIVNFPKYRSFQIESKLYSKGERNVYDPAFFLPLLSYLLVPESPLFWFHCIRRGVIGLAFIALSSEVSEIRAAACLVLSRFHSHIEAAKTGKDRLLWLHLVEMICRSTSKLQNNKISSIVAVFLGRSAMIFTEPEHPLYIQLGNYFKAKETHDFSIVPQLLPLLHSTDRNKKIHRNFILEVVRDGLKTENDLQVLFRSVAFKFLLDLHNSVLIDEEGRTLILQILANAVRISLGNNVLTTNYSILPWLNMVVHQGEVNSKNIPIYLEILSSLATCSKIKKLSFMKANVIYFLTQFMNVLKSTKVSEDDLVKYLKALCDAHWVSDITRRKDLDRLISVCGKFFDCSICNYYLKYGCEFVCYSNSYGSKNDNEVCHHLKLLTLKWIQSNKIKFCL